jgi:ribosomal protein S18 acetylase RimI-like enzyme
MIFDFSKLDEIMDFPGEKINLSIKKFNMNLKKILDKYFSSLKRIILELDKEQDEFTEVIMKERKVDQDFFSKDDIWIIEDEDVVIGFMQGYGDRRLTNDYHLYLIYVHPEYRGKGLASSLFNEMKKYAKSNRFEYLSLFCLTRNIPAMSMYMNLGFTETGKHMVKKI